MKDVDALAPPIDSTSKKLALKALYKVGTFALFLVILNSINSYTIANIQEKRDILRIVQRSDLIVRGKVISTESQWKEDSRGRHIYTTVTTKILDTIKGNITDEPFTFVVVGGTVDNITEVVSSTPAFEIDEEAIVFFVEYPLASEFRTICKILVYGSRVYWGGEEITTESFIRTLRIIEQDPDAKIPLGVSYQIPKEESSIVPVITNISSDEEPAGIDAQVTITGINFGSTQGSSKVEFFDKSRQQKITASIVSWSNKQIICKVPAGAEFGDSSLVTVATSNGTSLSYEFELMYIYWGLKWPGPSPVVPYRINENTSDCTGESAAVQSAANTWNDVGTNFRFQYKGTHSRTSTSRNYVNEIMWDIPIEDPDAVAETSIWHIGRTIVECDMVFNDPDCIWSADDLPTTREWDVESVALHEFGHWLHLADLTAYSDRDKVMYKKRSSGFVKRTLHADDIAGICYIYGGLRPDLLDRGESYRSFSPTTIQGGQNFSISTNIHNGGNVTSSSFEVKFYASSNTNISTSDYFIGEKYMSGISVGNSTGCTWTGAFPSSIPSDTYYVGWIIDSDNYVAESNENNNTAYKEDYRLTVLPSEPDLFDRGESYRSFSPRTIHGGQNLSISTEISNGGNAASGSFVVKFYVSSNTNMSTPEYYIGEKSMSSISAGSSADCDWAGTFTLSIPSGAYYVGWIIDSDKNVAESNEDNNTAYKEAYPLIVFPPCPDLFDRGESYRSFSPRTIHGGQNLSISADMRNGGNAPSGSFVVKFYASINTDINVLDYYIGEKSMPSIPADRSVGCDWTGVFPLSIPNDTYYVGWIIDSDNNVLESNEDNNIAYKRSYRLTVSDYILNLTKIGNGSIRVNGILRSLPWSGPFTPETNVILEAIPDSGWQFSGWSGDLSGSVNPTSILMNGDKSITANYTSIIVTSPDGGWYQLGDNLPIKWGSQNTFELAKIELYKSRSLERVIEEGIPNTGSYDWLIPIDGSLTGASDYQIKVSDVSNPFNGKLSNTFGIATPPQAHNCSISTSIDKPVTVTLHATDEGHPDPPGTITFIITSLPSHGYLNDLGIGLITDPNTLLVVYSNQVEYLPESRYEGKDSFTFIANDGGFLPGGGDSNEATVSVNTYIFFDDFPHPMLDPNNWINTSGTPTVESVDGNEPSLPYSLHLEHTDAVSCRIIDLSNRPSAQLHYLYKNVGTQSVDNLYLDYWDGIDWQILDTLVADDNTNWQSNTIDLPRDALNAQLHLRFQADCSSRLAVWYIDDVYIEAQPPYIESPVLHTEPDTTTGSSNTIHWDPVDGANEYYAECAKDEYFTNINAYSGWIQNTSYEFSRLAPGQTYWYRVKAREPYLLKTWLQTSQEEFQSDTFVDTEATSSGDVVLAARGTSMLDTIGGTSKYFTDGWCVFNGLLITTETILTQIEIYLGIENSVAIDFVVYKGGSQFSDQYKKIHSWVVSSSGTGTKFYSSGPVRIPLEVDTHYMIGAVWSGPVTIYMESGHSSPSFATHTGWGAYIGFSSPDTLSSAEFPVDPYTIYHRYTTNQSPGYISQGNTVSTAIDLPTCSNWDVVDFDITTPTGTAVTVDILSVTGSIPIPGYENVSTGDTLTDILATTIRLRANLSTDDIDTTPILHNWSVTYPDPAGKESVWSNIESSIQVTSQDLETDSDTD